MRTFGLATAVLLAICLVGWVGIADDNIQPKASAEKTKLTEQGKEFAVRMNLTDESNVHPLARPMLMMPADSPTSVHITGKRDFHGRSLLFGLKCSVTVHPLDDEHVLLDGELERSDASDTSDEIVYRTIHSLHFHCRVELGKPHEIKLKGPDGSPQVLSLRADSDDEQVPEIGK